MNDNNLMGAAVGQIGQAVGQAAKKVGLEVAKISEEVVKEAGKQIIGEKKEEKPSEKNKNDQYFKSDEERKEYLKHLYGSSDSSEKSINNLNANKYEAVAKDKGTSEFEKQIADKTPEEQKKLIAVRNQLLQQHKQTYYDPTFNPPKKQEEERPAEKVEKEKKQELAELQEKEAKKPPPLAVVRERNKAEMFRGVAG